MARTTPVQTKKKAKATVQLAWSISKKGTRYQDVGRVRLIECDEVHGWFVLIIDTWPDRFSQVARPGDIGKGIPSDIRGRLLLDEALFVRLIKAKYRNKIEQEGAEAIQ